MFNQVLIHSDDQVFHRFLWRTNESLKPKVYQWKRLNFGDKPAPDIAAGAIITLAKASQDQYPEAAKELRTHVYVDDIGGSQENENKSKQITSEIDAILSKGQFQIKQWYSNNKKVDQTDEERVDFLGHKWNTVRDIITFKKTEIVAEEKPVTKRNCLACLAQLWDPTGLVTPTTIEMRIDLKELWSSGYSWDEVLPDEIQTKWKGNVQVLNQLLKYEFKRKLKPDNAVGMPEIQGFCDAGEKAYGTAMFLRWKVDDGSYTCVQLMVKAFVSPLKKKSIPRLELMGCLALLRLYQTCREALEFAEISSCKKVFGIDSQVVLSWLKTSPRKFKPFVSVRVAEIQETINPQEFSYIRSEHNPADALKKGILPEQLGKWSQGPQFLRKPQEELPKFEENALKINEELSAEMKPPIEARPTSCDKSEFSTAQKELRDNPLFEHLMKTCSTFSKARKTLAYVLRFVNNTRKKTKNRDPISPKELTGVRTSVVQMVPADD